MYDLMDQEGYLVHPRGRTDSLCDGRSSTSKSQMHIKNLKDTVPPFGNPSHPVVLANHFCMRSWVGDFTVICNTLTDYTWDVSHSVRAHNSFKKKTKTKTSWFLQAYDLLWNDESCYRHDKFFNRWSRERVRVDSFMSHLQQSKVSIQKDNN